MKLRETLDAQIPKNGGKFRVTFPDGRSLMVDVGLIQAVARLPDEGVNVWYRFSKDNWDWLIGELTELGISEQVPPRMGWVYRPTVNAREANYELIPN